MVYNEFNKNILSKEMDFGHKVSKMVKTEINSKYTGPCMLKRTALCMKVIEKE